MVIVQLFGTLLSATLIGHSNAAGGAAATGGFDKMLQECSSSAQVEPAPKRPQGDTVTAQTESVVRLPLLRNMEDPERSTMGSMPLEILPSFAGFVSLCEEDTLPLSKKVGPESLQPSTSDCSIVPLAECRVPIDSREVPAQNTEQQMRAADPRALVAHDRKAIHWGAIISQWWMDISFEQAYRVLMESKTRDQLNGRFFHEWFDDVAQYRYGLWSDGDRFFTSYIGHPLQGAVIESIFWQNNDGVRFSEQDFHSGAYRKALVQAFAFAAVDAVQWKLGPVSEASIGHVGLPAHWWDTPYFCNLTHAYCHPRTGLNDLIMNEVGGTAMTIGFQWVDKHFQKAMEDRIHNRALIDTMRIFTNPPQSLANFFRFRTPWYRDNRQ
jgi:hypothetical protein